MAVGRGRHSGLRWYRNGRPMVCRSCRAQRAVVALEHREPVSVGRGRHSGLRWCRDSKAVAEELVRLSANPRSVVPPDLHMTVREIYKTVYPGFGAGTGSGAYAPGLQAGGSSTKASTSGRMLGKGVATMTKKLVDEDMRKRLETRHEFMILINH